LACLDVKKRQGEEDCGKEQHCQVLHRVSPGSIGRGTIAGARLDRYEQFWNALGLSIERNF
jgi:hypothetical protein